MICKRLLHGMQCPVFRQTFNGSDFRTIRLHRQLGAAFDSLPIDMDRASPAL